MKDPGARIRGGALNRRKGGENIIMREMKSNKGKAPDLRTNEKLGGRESLVGGGHPCRG